MQNKWYKIKPRVRILIFFSYCTNPDFNIKKLNKTHTVTINQSDLNRLKDEKFTTE